MYPSVLELVSNLGGFPPVYPSLVPPQPGWMFTKDVLCARHTLLGTWDICLKIEGVEVLVKL